MTKSNARKSAPSTSLLGLLLGSLRTGSRSPQSRPASPHYADNMGSGMDAPLAPLPFVHALERLSAACGMTVARAHLTAGFPVSEGDLDPRFAPFALARAGLDARWEAIRLHHIQAHDLPALTAVREGGAIVITAISLSSRTARIIDAGGERTVALPALEFSISEQILTCGHLDPENGLDEDSQQDLVQRNPRLWLLGVFLAEKKRIGQLLLAAVFLNLCALAIPLYMRAIYDRVVPNLAIESLWALSVGMVIVLLFEFLFRHVRSGFVDAVSIRVGQSVQHRAMNTVLNARMKHGGKSVGALMVGLRDVEQLAMLAPQAAVTFLVDVPWFL
ncbi:MAG: ABC transporter transmembrane domain-containing protein, partial [Sphingobium sp.]